MARPLRIDLAAGLYQVTSRGDRREDIYRDEKDRGRARRNRREPEGSTKGLLQARRSGYVGARRPAPSMMNYAGHAVVGCASAEAQGGNCARGAAAQLASKWATINTKGNPVAAVIAGGTVSVIGGGKFANGAITAAAGYLFNAFQNMVKGHSVCNAQCHDIQGMEDRELLPADESAKMGHMVLGGVAINAASGGVGFFLNTWRAISWFFSARNAAQTGWVLSVNTTRNAVITATPVITNPAVQQSAIDFSTSLFPGSPAMSISGGIAGIIGNRTNPENLFR